jgi:hypothetical protein
MKIYIETQPQPGGWLSVITFDVTAERRPVENVFYGLRYEVQKERNRRCERWSEIADEVTANALPVARQ